MEVYMECTDCKFCANFDDGYRVFCLNPKLPPNETEKYLPLDKVDAYECGGFNTEGNATIFTYKQLREALKYAKDKYGEFFLYKGIREWCELQTKQEITLEGKKQWKS